MSRLSNHEGRRGMNQKFKKVYCCSPRCLRAGIENFWHRDMGLISQTLLSMGVESKCVLPLPYHDVDWHDYLIRTEYSNLESAEWWKSLQIDALVLYSWGAPCYRRVASAVRKAGIFLHIHMDTSGDFLGADYAGKPWYLRLWTQFRVKAQDLFRSWHLRQADILTMGPDAAEKISRKLFYGKWVRERCVPMPCPVSPLCRYDGEMKENIILCIGRWDDIFQKRPELLMDTLSCYYAGGGSAETRIFGTITDELRLWHAHLPAETAEKVKLMGFLQNSLLWQEYKKSRVILCPSRFESSHIVSAEALCCGCSVVTPPLHESLCDVIWYTTRESGTIAAEDSAGAMADALHQEIAHWEAGRRNPVSIAEAWQPHFHADKVLNKIFE